MIYLCRCGEHFTEDEVEYKNYDEETGVSEMVCPYCGRGSIDIEEAGHCIKCGGYFPLNEMVGSICDECLAKRMTVENAYRYGERETPEGALNAFISWAWDMREASEELLKACTPEDARGYCKDDIYSFSEWLEGQNDDE